VVTLRITRFNINKILRPPHSEFMRFVWISEKTVIISLYRIRKTGV